MLVELHPVPPYVGSNPTTLSTKCRQGVRQRLKTISPTLVVTFKNLSNAQRGYVMNARWDYI